MNISIITFIVKHKNIFGPPKIRIMDLSLIIDLLPKNGDLKKYKLMDVRDLSDEGDLDGRERHYKWERKIRMDGVQNFILAAKPKTKEICLIVKKLMFKFLLPSVKHVVIFH